MLDLELFFIMWQRYCIYNCGISIKVNGQQYFEHFYIAFRSLYEETLPFRSKSLTTQFPEFLEISRNAAAERQAVFS